MANRFELLIELNGERKWLDTYKSEPISLTFNVADIVEIDKRNASFSKTIKLPETKNNRIIFGDISDLGVSATFNPNKKTKAWILSDTVVVFDGYLQLRKVIVNNSVDKCEYEVVIFADNDNFYKLLGDSFITDLDFSELDHDWTASNIISSWTASYEKGYFYPLIDYGYNWSLGDINGWTTTYNTQVKTTQLYPATNIKYIFDKIFNNAGYNYSSSFLNSEIFESLYTPFNRQELVRNINSLDDKFTIGMVAAATYSKASTTLIPQDYIDGQINFNTTQGSTNNPNDKSINFGKFRLPFNNETAPFGDPDNLYNTTTFEYTAPANFVAGRFVCDFDISWLFTSNLDTLTIEGTSLPLTSISFRRSRNPATGLTVSAGYTIPINGAMWPLRFTASQIPGIVYQDIQTLISATQAAPSLNSISIYPGPRRVIGQIASDILDDSTTNRKKLYPGEKVWVELNYGALNSQIRKQFGNSNLLPPSVNYTANLTTTTYNTTFPAGVVLGTFSSSNKFYNVLSENIMINEQIDYSSVLPQNFKQKDFINSIIKMFNLIVEPSKENENTLIIEPRDDYYGSGVVKDWSNKLNINQPIEEQILAETQNKQTNFRYKDDKDIYNEDYKNNHKGIAYGEYQFIFDNDFIKGQKKVEISFSPTPLVPVSGSNQLIIPKIGKVNNGIFSRTEHNPRILTRFNSSTGATWSYDDYQFNTGGNFNAFTKLTTDGFTNITHPNYKVGDWIMVNQSDGGVAKPALQSQFKIVEIVDTKTIVVNLPFSLVGAGAAISGIITPLNGLLPTATDSDSWKFEGVKYKAYPYLGHFDNPQNPSYDLNYGQTQDLYYPEEDITNNNLYSSFYENMINEISDKDSRIITASFYLTPFDISDFRFNDNIFIHGQYFKVNKILNYDPTRETLVKVELIKSLYTKVLRPFVKGAITQKPLNTIAIGLTSSGKPFTLTGFNAAGNDIIFNKPSGKAGSPFNVLKTSQTNLITEVDSMVAGKENEVYTRNVIVSGNNNLIASPNNYIQGNNNSIELGEGGNFLVGSNNKLGAGVKSSFIFGSNLKIDEPGFYIENSFIISSGEVSASRDEVLNPNSNKIINYISASRDVVRELGSNDVINYLDGGRYIIE